MIGSRKGKGCADARLLSRPKSAASKGHVAQATLKKIGPFKDPRGGKVGVKVSSGKLGKKVGVTG